MNSKTNLRIALILITLVAIVSMGFKIKPILKNYDDFNPEKVYKVNYNYFFKSEDESGTVVKTFIPKSNSRQRISSEKVTNDSSLFFAKNISENGNVRGVWGTDSRKTYYTVNYEFIFEGKDRTYTIPDQFNLVSEKDDQYLKPSSNIQSDDIKISELTTGLKQNTQNDKAILKNVFDYVVAIPSAPIITLTDALTAIEQNRASCNGKSRLFVAICRNLGYPARIKGGIILENTDKRTSHVWAEVLIDQTEFLGYE